MLENAGEDGLMSFALVECGRVQMSLANEAMEHEAKVEQYVATPLQHILDTDVPNILKHKRNLHRLTMDMDSARTRYFQAVKLSHSKLSTGNDLFFFFFILFDILYIVITMKFF